MIESAQPEYAEPEMTVAVEGQNLGEATVTFVHGGQEPARAAVLDDDGVVTAVVLVPADWDEQDPATRYQPDGDVVLLTEHDAPVVGGHWDHEQGWVAPAPEPDPEPVLTDADRLRRDVDAVLGLLLTAQSGGPAPDVDWPDVLAGMVARGTAAEHELRGAHGWQLIDETQLDDLLAGVDPVTS